MAIGDAEQFRRYSVEPDELGATEVANITDEEGGTGEGDGSGRDHGFN